MSEASPERHDAGSTTVTATRSFITYPSDELVRLGQVCSRRLPPASAVQAMFLYEMQRETEAEKLFHQQMFRLARTEHESHEKDKLIEDLTNRLTKLEAKMSDRERDDRLATSLVRMQSLAQNLQDCLQRVSALDIRVTVLQNKLQYLDKEEMKLARITHETAAKQLPDSSLDEMPHRGDIERIDADVEAIYKDNQDLWKDRHAMQTMITDLQGRIQQLEKQDKEKKDTATPLIERRNLPSFTPSSQTTAMTTSFAFPPLQQTSMMFPAYPMGPPQYWGA